MFAKTLLWVITLLLFVICRPAIFFTIYKTSLTLRKCFRRNLRYMAKFVIMLALKFKFFFLILPFYKIKLLFLIFVKISLLRRLIYCFIVDNRNLEIVNRLEMWDRGLLSLAASVEWPLQVWIIPSQRYTML